MNSISIKVEPIPDAVRVHLAGDFTENADFTPLLAQSANRLIFDLGEVRRINSCGVREWINFINALQKAGRTFALERCSVPFVNQLNMISNFRGGAEVISIFAPYFCEGCGEQHTRLLQLAGDVSQTLKEQIPCPACGAPMELDDTPENYVGFLT
jgi:anti-anti-sigma regulatory factor